MLLHQKDVVTKAQGRDEINGPAPPGQPHSLDSVVTGMCVVCPALSSSWQAKQAGRQHSAHLSGCQQVVLSLRSPECPCAWQVQEVL